MGVLAHLDGIIPAELLSKLETMLTQPEGTSDIADGAVTSAKLATGAVTKAKTAMFVSTEQTGTGSSQNIAHGLGVTPTVIFAAPTDTSPSTVGVYTVTEGSHTSTNVVLTVTSGKKFKVMAWA